MPTFATSRTLVARVTVPVYAQYFIEAFGREFRAALRTSELLQKIYRKPPQGDMIVPCVNDQWRVYAGGITAQIAPAKAVAQAGVQAPETPKRTRVVITFDDPTVARQALMLDLELKRRQLWLRRAEDGNWLAVMRWHDPAQHGQQFRGRRRSTAEKAAAL